MGKKPSLAEIDYTTALNDQDRQQDCVIASCTVGFGESECVWGHGNDSVKRALANLTEICDCGATFHTAAGVE